MSEGVFFLSDSLPGDVEDTEVECDGEDSAEESEFFADDGEDEVGGIFGEVAEFLDAASETSSEEAAGGEAEEALDHVVTFFFGGGVGVDEGGHAFPAVFFAHDEPQACDEDGWDDEGEMPEFGAAGDAHGEGAKSDECGGSEVFDDDEEADSADGDECGDEAGEFGDVDGTLGEDPGEEEDAGPLSKFGGLDLYGADFEPPPGAVDFVADAWDEDGEAGEYGDDKDPEDGAFEPSGGGESVVVEGTDGEEGDEGDSDEDEMPGTGVGPMPSGVLSCVGETHGGGLDHDDAECEEGEDAE